MIQRKVSIVLVELSNAKFENGSDLSCYMVELCYIQSIENQLFSDVRVTAEHCNNN